jgi:hypothetical protein
LIDEKALLTSHLPKHILIININYITNEKKKNKSCFGPDEESRGGDGDTP